MSRGPTTPVPALISVAVAAAVTGLLVATLELLHGGAPPIEEGSRLLVRGLEVHREPPRMLRAEAEPPPPSRRRPPRRPRPLRVKRVEPRAEPPAPRPLRIQPLLLSADLRWLGEAQPSAVAVTMPVASSSPTVAETSRSAEPVSLPLNLTQVDEPPRRIGGSGPRYPPRARRMGIEGSVDLELTIDGRGCVTEVRVRSSRGSERFEHAAMEAVRQWRFRPARKDGRPVPVHCVVTIRFELEE